MPTARAEFIVTIVQDGADVVVSGSGTIDTTDLTPLAVVIAASGMIPSSKFIMVGPPVNAVLQDYYTSGRLVPFGSGGRTSPSSSGSGSTVGFEVSEIFVPDGYASGFPLADTSIYDNATFASLGLTAGTYTASWGSGADADSFVLEIGVIVNPAPEPSGAMLLALPLAALGLLARGAHPAHCCVAR
jgi:hypothetical protein